MALQENKGGFENLSPPPPSNAYLKGHLFPLVATIIKAQVINCFFVIINCEGFPPPPPKKQKLGQQQQEREGHPGTHTVACQASGKEREGEMNFVQ